MIYLSNCYQSFKFLIYLSNFSLWKHIKNWNIRKKFVPKPSSFRNTLTATQLMSKPARSEDSKIILNLVRSSQSYPASFPLEDLKLCIYYQIHPQVRDSPKNSFPPFFRQKTDCDPSGYFQNIRSKFKEYQLRLLPFIRHKS